jgi:hypothetical protein
MIICTEIDIFFFEHDRKLRTFAWMLAFLTCSDAHAAEASRVLRIYALTSRSAADQRARIGFTNTHPAHSVHFRALLHSVAQPAAHRVQQRGARVS